MLLRGVGLESAGGLPHLLFMAFQGTFAIITAALISGAVVERMHFGPYLAFIGLCAQGHGGELEQVETYRGTTVKMELVEKVRLEIGVSEAFVEPTIEALTGAARTGEVGDGKIFVLPVEKVLRIRTGEEDQAAVTPAQPMTALA